MISFIGIYYFTFQGLKLGVVRFRFDGNPINETDTPHGVSIHLHFCTLFVKLTLVMHASRKKCL